MGRRARTDIQKCILDVMSKYRWTPPSMDELSKACKMSKSGIFTNLRQMEEDGLLLKSNHKSRSYVPVTVESALNRLRDAMDVLHRLDDTRLNGIIIKISEAQFLIEYILDKDEFSDLVDRISGGEK